MRPALLVVALAVAGCARGPEVPPFTGEPYLVVWAGDTDRQNSDFLAVLDADPTSAAYGKVLKTYPVGSRGNEANALNTEPRGDRRLFATGLLTNRTFVFYFRQPIAARLVRVDEAGARRTLWAPQEPVSLPGGRVAVACSDPARYRGEAREVVTSAGGLLELDADGKLKREISAAEPRGRGLLFAPSGAAVAWPAGRLVTADTAHGYTATTEGERMPGIGVQIWRLTDLTLVKTVALEAGPRGEENLGPVTARAMRRKPFVFVNTEGGALYASDSVQSADPLFRLVFDFGAGALSGGAAITPDDRFYVVALTGQNRVVSLDLADPWHPKQVSSVRLDRDPADPSRRRSGGPCTVVMGGDGTRVAVSDYTVDVPGYFRDGDHRVHILRLDPDSGRLRVDTAFLDELAGNEGIDFDRTRWPHGETGSARPKGLLFVTPEPPPASR